MDSSSGNSRLAAALQAKKDRGEDVKIKTPLEKLAERPKSFRLAINAFCFQCHGGSAQSMPDPGWRKAIGDCASTTCALHALRPYQKRKQ